MQHAGLFLYPRTRKLITSSLHMNQIQRPLTFLTPPPPAPNRRKSQSNKRVSWHCEKGVKIYNYWRCKHENNIKFREKKKIKNQPRHPLRSYPIINKVIWPLIINNHINYWARLPGGTAQDIAILLPKKISMEILLSDLRYIYNHFRQGKLAPINFNKGLRLNGEIKIGQWNRIHKRFVNCRILVLSPLLRRYLINVMRDTKLAATSIQVAWRRYKNIKELARRTSS